MSLKHPILSPIVGALAVVYFIADAVAVWVFHPVSEWFGRQPWVIAALERAKALGPWPTLGLFLIPLAIFEPVKPYGFYLIATGSFWTGVTVIVVGGFLKVVVMERLFRACKDKLLMIGWFAWCYNLVVGFFNWIKSLPAWIAVSSLMRTIRERVRAWMTANGLRK